MAPPDRSPSLTRLGFLASAYAIGLPAWGTSSGLPVPESRRCFLRAARMAERRKHRVSAGQDARSERPATGMGSPERGDSAG